MFDPFKDEKPRGNGTPRKVKKIISTASFDDEMDLGLSLTRKKSLIDCFHFVGAINRKDSCKLPMLRKQSTNRVPFAFDSEDDCKELYNSKKLRKDHGMDIEHPGVETLSESSEEELPRDIKLVKRVTMISPSNMEIFPRLFRCNSGINIEEGISEMDDQKYGDNIYLEQINALCRKNTGRSKQNNSRAANLNFRQNYNRKTYQIDSDEQEQTNLQERLRKDYEVSSNLHGYMKHHENYLCLNKLQRIFYYVKKINFSDEYTEDDIFELVQLQIRLYNRDEESHMVRFYQSWEEEDGVYLVFETASTTLQQKLESGIKLRENQIWSLLADTSAALTWMKQSDEYHLNIKPGNLIKCREKFKLADPFLNGQILSRALAMFKGEVNEQEKLRLAFSYSAPQILEYKSFVQGLQYEKCDVFSLGLCILENITGIPVLMLRRDLKSIKTHKEKYLKGYSPMLRNLLTKMISLDPQKRPTPQEINNIRQLQSFTFQTKKEADELSSKKIKRKLSL